MKTGTRLKTYTYNGNNYGATKMVFVRVLHICLQVELSTLKRYFIKDKIRLIELGGDNYLPDS